MPMNQTLANIHTSCTLIPRWFECANLFALALVIGVDDDVVWYWKRWCCWCFDVHVDVDFMAVTRCDILSAFLLFKIHLHPWWDDVPVHSHKIMKIDVELTHRTTVKYVSQIESQTLSGVRACLLTSDYLFFTNAVASSPWIEWGRE